MIPMSISLGVCDEKSTVIKHEKLIQKENLTFLGTLRKQNLSLQATKMVTNVCRLSCICAFEPSVIIEYNFMKKSIKMGLVKY